MRITIAYLQSMIKDLKDKISAILHQKEELQTNLTLSHKENEQLKKELAEMTFSNNLGAEQARNNLGQMEEWKRRAELRAGVISEARGLYETQKEIANSLKHQVEKLEIDAMCYKNTIHGLDAELKDKHEELVRQGSALEHLEFYVSHRIQM